MQSRREAMAFGLAGMAAAGGLLPASRAAAADRMVPLAGLNGTAFHHSAVNVLANADRVAVPSYRLGVVMRSGISATGASGSVAMEATAELTGVDLAMLRRIAHEAFSDFVTKLRATGRTVVGWEEMSATKGFAKFEPSAAPFVKKPFADARTVAVVSPEYLPLINQHSDAPLSDKSPLSLGNWRAINAICADLKSVLVIPSVVLDFAALTGSGHKSYGASARVGIQPGLYLVPVFTKLSAHFAKIALAGPGGGLTLKERIAIGQAGTLVQTGSHNNRDEIERWNAYVRSNSWWSQSNMAAPDRPTGAYDYSSYQYRVDPDQFVAACLDGARAANSIYAGVINAYRPG